MSDIYSSPESYGLRILSSLDDRDLTYEFDMFVVWERIEDGALFYASDSGCSCPSPFEQYDSIKDLTPITPASIDSFESAVKSWNTEYREDNRPPKDGAANEMISEVRDRLRRRVAP